MTRPLTTCLLVAAIAAAILGLLAPAVGAVLLATVYQFFMDGIDDGLG